MVDLLFAVDSRHMMQANLEMNHENEFRREVDEIVHDCVDRVICQDKHLLYGDIWPLLHLHYHHLFDISIQDLGLLDKIVVGTLDRGHKIHHLHDILVVQSPNEKQETF